MGTRRRGRELAVQALYRMELTGDPAVADLAKTFENFESTTDARRFGEELVRGVVEERDRIDPLLASALENWSLERLSRVDANILRVAIYELFHPEHVPPSGAINEAIELAHRFGGDDAARFVNGVLDRIAGMLGVRERDRKSADE